MTGVLTETQAEQGFEVELDDEQLAILLQAQAELDSTAQTLRDLTKPGDPATQYEAAHNAFANLINHDIDPYGDLFEGLELPFDLKGFHKLMQGKAAQAAVESALDANEKLDDNGSPLRLAIDEIDTHPFYDVDDAFRWVKASGAPLFSNKTYRDMGLTRDEFITWLRDMHTDAAKQFLRLAREQRDSGTPDELGLECLNRVEQTHFPALGIEKLDGNAALIFDMDSDEYIALLEYFTAWQFRQQWDAVHNYAAGHIKRGPAYCMMVIEAYCNARQSDRLLKNPDTYAGTGISYEKLRAEYETCLETVIAYYAHIMTSRDGELQSHQYQPIIDAMETLHQLVPDLENHPAFGSYNYKNYTEFMRHILIGSATAQLHEAQEVEEPDLETWQSISDAQEKLKTLNIQLHSEFVSNLRVNVPVILNTLSQVVPYAANQLWAVQAMPNMIPEIQLQNAQNLQKVLNQISPDDLNENPPVPLTAFSQRLRALRLRRAEELMFESLITIPGSFGSYTPLKEAYDLLHNLEISVLSDKFTRATRMSYVTAHSIDEQFTLLQTVDDWKAAQNPNNDPLMRLKIILDVVEQYERYLGIVQDDTAAEPPVREDELLRDFHLLTSTQGEDDVYKAQREIAREYINYARGVDFSDIPDKQDAFEIIEGLFNSVHVLGPERNATTTAFTFKRITGFEYEPLRALYEELFEWQSMALNPLPPVFEAMNEAQAVIEEARDSATTGAEAYTMLAELSRKLEFEGDTIVDSRILEACGLTHDDLKTMVHGFALRAATDSLELAKAKTGFVLTPDNADSHPYHDLAAAMTWVDRSPLNTVLQNAPYKAMGLTGRKAFMDMMRAALQDYTLQLEIMAVKSGPQVLGAHRYIKTLNTILEGYYNLGVYTMHDGERALTQETPTFGEFSPNAMQRALRKHTHSAIADILAEANDIVTKDGSVSPQRHGYVYKAMMDMAGIARRAFVTTAAYDEWLHAEGPKGEPSPATVIDHALKNRINNAVLAYKARPGDPARGQHFATALKNMADGHGLHNVQWFQELFLDHFYDDFQTFCETCADARIRQIVTRVDKLMMDEDSNLVDIDSATGLRVLRDLQKIDDMETNGLISPGVMFEVYQQNKIEPEMLQNIREDAAIVAVPLLAAIIRDPLLHDAARERRMDELERYLDITGKHVLAQTVTPLDDFTRIQTNLIRHSAATAFMMDMLRGNQVPFVNENTFVTHDILSRLRVGFLHEETLRSIGLGVAETAYYKMLEPYVQMAKCLYAADNLDHDMNKQSEVIFSFHAHAAKAGIDVASPVTLKKIGLRSNADLFEKLDRPSMRIMVAYRDTIAKHQDNPDTVREIAALAGAFIEGTAIEKRYTPETFASNNIPTAAYFAEIAGRATMQAGRYNSMARYISKGAPLKAPANTI